jgi:hypothetical protein
LTRWDGLLTVKRQWCLVDLPSSCQPSLHHGKFYP